MKSIARVAAIAAACGLSFWAAIGPATAAGETISASMEDNTDRPGSDYDRFHIDDQRPDRCQSECARQKDRCRAWTYVRPGIHHRLAVCYLKSAVPQPTPNNCCISGVQKKVVALGKKPPANVPNPGDVTQEPDGISARCKPGYVPREARPGDDVCVTPESATRTARENAAAESRRDPNGAWGPYSCIAGFVWREAYDGDVVCVTPEIRALVKEENRLGPSRSA